jgi:DNA-binding winged helix-turn-helix (wHTH) protein/tetratricopeptide (TPR) repeat protein
VSATSLDRIQLAQEPPFRIGRVDVVPATREVVRGAITETIEPRVMQVLIVLARRRDTVVTREQLIQACWNDRVVTDDAVNRVLSRIRQLAGGIGAGSFKLDTIARVGYRLRELTHEEAPGVGVSPPPDTTAPVSADAGELAPADAAAPTVSAPPERAVAATPARSRTATRRAIVIGLATLVVGGTAAGLGWRQRQLRATSLEARQLYERASLLFREALPGQIRQGVSYLERAVRLDPGFGPAWGALALGYSHLVGDSAEAEQDSLPDRIHNAAERAFELDGGNADAELALISLIPAFRNWTDKEARLQTVVRDHPRHWLAHGRLAMLLYQVGRLNDGVTHHRSALAIEPVLPVAYSAVIRNLSALGRIQEAEAAVEKARQLWPAHPAIWLATFDHYLYSGRPRAAAGFASDATSLPSGFGPPQVDRRLRLAKALETRAPADVAVAVDELQTTARAQVGAIPMIVPALAALGRADLVFDALERYLLDRGPFDPDARRAEGIDRSTDMLFTLPLASLRADPRFESLVATIGLADYWRGAGREPDYRRSLA